ncbi:MAG: bifunctional 2-C-methyl-D-erythritol 4-phosphate cytidylyltransferase/2-C-methyl-D-erythritol 2,4-cyclodiphosphate synthase [Methyloligellaceae bacterium]
MTGTAALIVAAGQATRFGVSGTDALPKQYLQLHGKTVLEYSLRILDRHPAISEIQIVIHPEHLELFNTRIEFSSNKLNPVVYGGHTRQSSVQLGLKALEKSDPENVLIHDAARPFLTIDLIDRILDRLNEAEAVIPGIPIADTIKKICAGEVVDTVDRTDLYRVQTPQGFRFPRILAAHKAIAETSDLDLSDDAAIAEWYNLKVHMVAGSEDNWKLTFAEDFDRARHQLQRRKTNELSTHRTGSGFDVHAFETGTSVILCGVKIPFERSLKGHSDADVALHALTDALFGALAEGDIGSHFPPSDDKWKNASSDLFLKAAVNRVRERGGSINHVDITIICEAPKIGPHRDNMRHRVGEILDLDPGYVSIKATTSEGLGFTGRREGIAAMATATVTLPDGEFD